jgi:hypothetical protein
VVNSVGRSLSSRRWLRAAATALALILSEKAGINVSEATAASKPLDGFIQKFAGDGGQADAGHAKAETASTAKAGKRDNGS